MFLGKAITPRQSSIGGHIRFVPSGWGSGSSPHRVERPYGGHSGGHPNAERNRRSVGHISLCDDEPKDWCGQLPHGQTWAEATGVAVTAKLLHTPLPPSHPDRCPSTRCSVLEVAGVWGNDVADKTEWVSAALDRRSYHQPSPRHKRDARKATDLEGSGDPLAPHDAPHP